MYYLPKIENCNNCMASAEAVISNLNINQLEHLDGEIFGHDYWFNRGASFIDSTMEQVKFFKEVSSKIKSLISSNNVRHEYNDNGLIVRRSSCIGTMSDFMRTLGADFETFLDIDFCHAYWINHSTLQMISYCEADVVLLTASDANQLKLEMDTVKAWYKENY
jgi:hypothetical protein